MVEAQGGDGTVPGSRLRSGLRRLVLHAGLFGAIVVAVLLGFHAARGRPLLGALRLLALTGALAGAATMPTIGLELLASGSRVTWRRAVVALALLCVLGPGGVALGVVQGASTETVFETGSIVAGLEAARATLPVFGESEVWTVVLALGLVAVPVVLARIWRVGLLAQVVIALASARLLGSIVWRGNEDHRGEDRVRVAVLLALGAAGYALAGRAAEVLERRLARRFSWEVGPEPAASVERPRLGWRKGLALAFLTAGLVVELSGVRWASVLDGLRLPWRRAVPWRGPTSLPAGLRLAGRKVPAADGTEVELYLWTLPGRAGAAGTEQVRKAELELVYVPPGDFTMGDEDGHWYEKPRYVHAMPLGYWIGRTDVTWGQYLAFCEASGHEEPRRPGWGKDDHPVLDVSWDDANAYCAWAGLALPSEAEWEKAARGTDARRFPWGNEAPTGELGTFLESSGRQAAGDFLARLGLLVKGPQHTRGVEECPLGVSPYGALDMLGNVCQWCEDWFDSHAYQRYKSGDTAPPEVGLSRVLRGGCWYWRARSCRSSIRASGAPGTGFVDRGFRVVLRSP